MMSRWVRCSCFLVVLPVLIVSGCSDDGDGGPGPNADAKAADARLTDAKAADAKPADVTATDSKAADAKLADLAGDSGVTPTTATKVVGMKGGTATVKGAKTTVTLKFPPGALEGNATVKLTLMELTGGQAAAAGIGPVVDIDVTFPTGTTLKRGAKLTFSPAGAKTSIARWSHLPGTVQVVKGNKSMTKFERWIPLPDAHVDSGKLATPLWSFSRFAAITYSDPNVTPPKDLLTSPTPPSGYTYMGREVLVNGVQSQKQSNSSVVMWITPKAKIQVKSAVNANPDMGKSNEVTVGHVYLPTTEASEKCEVDPKLLTPVSKPCFKYVGYTVFINGRNAKRSYPLGRKSTPYQMDTITYKQKTVNNTAVCTILVSHILDATAPPDCWWIKDELPGSASGVFTICPDKKELKAYCDMTTDGGGWTIIDAKRSSLWSGYFSEWNSVAGGTAAGAKKSCFSWRDWFSLESVFTEFRRSPGCTTVDKTKDRIYRMTGNYYGCEWYNTLCNQVGDTCSKCTATTGKVEPGRCTHLDDSVDHADSLRGTSKMTYCHSCTGDWWNSAPSIGTNGKYCVGYRVED